MRLRQILDRAVTGDTEAAARLLREVRRRDDDSVLGTLIEGPQTDARWRMICRLLEAGIGSPGPVDAALTTAGWPDALRRAPLRWLQAVEHARPPRWLPVVRAIDVRGVPMMHRVVRAPGLRAVSHLRVAADGHGDEAVAYLVEQNPLPLRHLDLAGTGVSSGALTALGASATGRQLRGLRLDDNRLAVAGTEALADARFPALERLAIRRVFWAEPALLAGAAWWPQLAHLALAEDREVGVLLDRLPARLRSLELGPADPETQRQLATCGGLSLTTLGVVDSALDPEAVSGWRSARWRPGLRELNLSGSTVSPEAQHALDEALRGGKTRVTRDPFT